MEIKVHLRLVTERGFNKNLLYKDHIGLVYNIGRYGQLAVSC